MTHESTVGESSQDATRPPQARGKLFIALLALFVAWISLLIVLNLAT